LEDFKNLSTLGVFETNTLGMYILKLKDSKKPSYEMEIKIKTAIEETKNFECS